MTKERTLSRVREDLAAGRRGVAVRRLRALLAADPGDLEPYRLLTEVYRSAGNAAEAGRWGYLTGDASTEEIQAFERAHPQPWARLRLLGKSLDPARLPAAARVRLTELQRQATEVTIPIQHPGVGSRAVPGTRTAPRAGTTPGSATRPSAVPAASAAAPSGVETGTEAGSDEPPTLRLSAGTAAGTGAPGTPPAVIPAQRQPEPGRPTAVSPLGTAPPETTTPTGTAPAGTAPAGETAGQDPLREADPTVAIWLPDGAGTDVRTGAVGQQRARASRWSLPPAGRHSSTEPSVGGADRPAGTRGLASSAATRSLDVAGRVLGAARYLVVGTNRARDQYRSAGESTRNFILLGLLILVGLIGSVAAVGGVRAIFGIHNWLSPVRAIIDALERLFTG